MTTSLPYPTPELRPLAVELGLDGLLVLLEHRRGTRLPVPVKVGTSELVDELGEEVTAALVRAWGGCVIKVPLGREWLVQIWHGRGLSYAEIASRIGLTEDGVWRILRSSGLTRRGEPRRTPTKRPRRPPAEPAEPPAQLDIEAWIDGRS